MTEELKSKIVWQEDKDFGKVCTLTESALNGIINEATKELQEKIKNQKKDYETYYKSCFNAQKKLEKQIEKMKCCGNCRFSESDKLNGTFCHREGCFVVASGKKCKLWELTE